MAVVINGTTGISGVAGSAGTPAYQGTDTDSGFFINSANEPSASVNGSPVWNSASTFGFKNRLINGDMRIDQRNGGASVTLSATTAFAVDRFGGIEDTDGGMTAQQNSSAPAGFVNSLKFTTTTADATLAATQYARCQQRIEGYNIADLNWGSANAKTVTLSFWVRSSLTGTFGGALTNNGFDRSYPFTYTISVADTWEYKTITIAGDTSGTWLTTNGLGIQVIWGLGVGSTYSGTAGAWAGAGYLSATGATSVIGTLNATWYITGVQLEVGPSATSFDYRPYGTELQLCQRYFYLVANGNDSQIPGSWVCQSGGVATTPYADFQLIVPMRTLPTVSQTATQWRWNGTQADVNVNGTWSLNAGIYAPTIGGSNVVAIRFQFSATVNCGEMGLTRIFTNGGNLALSAEL